MGDKWTTVTKGHPCPICGKDNARCGIANNGSACICHLVKTKGDKINGGWRHPLRKITEADLPPEMRYSNKGGKKKERAPQGPFKEEYFACLPTGDDQRKFCAALAEKLGVDARALESLDVRWDEKQLAAAFPMRTPDGMIYTGVAYRYVKTGQKFNADKSVAGLFIPRDLDLYDGHLYVCEGASDTAAAISAGMRNVVGRPGCRTCEAMIAEFCRLRGITRVTIMADNDKPKPGEFVGAGISGAQHLAQTLEEKAREDGDSIEVKIWLPDGDFKDLRAQYSAGREVKW